MEIQMTLPLSRFAYASDAENSGMPRHRRPARTILGLVCDAMRPVPHKNHAQRHRLMHAKIKIK